MENRIVSTLMKRDNLTKAEAQKQLANVSELVNDAIAAGNFDEVEDIMASELGLEMDYIDDILF